MTERRYITGDGLSLYFRDCEGPGRRTPLLCLPGLTRNSADFADLTWPGAMPDGGGWKASNALV